MRLNLFVTTRLFFPYPLCHPWFHKIFIRFLTYVRNDNCYKAENSLNNADFPSDPATALLVINPVYVFTPLAKAGSFFIKGVRALFW